MKLKKKILDSVFLKNFARNVGIPTETPLARFLTNFNIFRTTLKLGYKLARYYISRPGVVTN